MKAQIQQYITAQTNRWAPTTLRSESARLHAASDALEMASVAAAYEVLSSRLQPYTLKTTMVRCADFRAFFGDSSWKAWIRTNARLFKNAYTKERISVDFTMANELIADVQDPIIRDFALEILHSGLRVSEALSRHESTVVGKGGRSRRVYGLRDGRVTAARPKNYWAFYSGLKQATGLKPHTLRKAFATQLARSGKVSAQDLMEVLGWTSLQTATSYLQPLQEQALDTLIKNVTETIL